MAEMTIRMRDINDSLKTAGRDDRLPVLEGIEALKRWIYGQAYQGREKEPAPATEDEFSLLMDGLRRWATLHAPHIDTGRLQDYRRAELGLPAAFELARVFPDQFAEREWKQAAARADDALNELKILLTEAEAQKTKKRMTRKEVNERAMELATRLGQEFFLLSGRKQARLIGCSWKTWERTDFCKEAKKRNAKLPPKKGSGTRPTVSFTRDLESVTGKGQQDEVLNQLIADQQADDEPSPLDDSRPEKAFFRKRL